MSKLKKRSRSTAATSAKKTRRKANSRKKTRAARKPSKPVEAQRLGKVAPPAPREAEPVSGEIGFSDGIFDGEPSPADKAETVLRTSRRPRRSKKKSAVKSEADSARGSAKKARTRTKRRRKARASAGVDAGSEVPVSAPEVTGADVAALLATPSKASDAALPAPTIDFDESEYGPMDAGRRDDESGVKEAEKARPDSKKRAQKKPRKKHVARGAKGAKPAPVKPALQDRAGAEKREMLINVSDGDECRISLLRDGRLEELYIERATSTSNVGNIYKGRVTNVEPSIQAAFVDFGLPSHGFLHISDLHPKYFPDSKGEPELVGKKTPRRHRPPIQGCLRPGQEVIVQVIKEGIGTKGPTLSSYISLPGRFLVMMPDMGQLGVSRKIEDEDQRRKMRGLLGQLSLPKDTGFIVRTAGVDRTKRDLQRDLNYLTRLWKKVAARIKTEPAPAELYKESDLVIRTIRDVYDSTLSAIIVDSPAVAERVREFLAIASPRSQDIVTCYEDAEPMFHRFGIESEIDKLHARQVPLPCGGSLVIEPTEALVAIDVNSGRFRVPESAEETAYSVNLEAVDEIARQLRLRDLGGLIILDLIDMTQERHRRTIERRLTEALKKHKERAKILRISKFGILEMTRQRQRPSFAKSVFQDCPRCGGSGRVKAVESVALDVMRQIRLASQKEGIASIDVRVAASAANDLLNRKRRDLTDLERAAGQRIRIHGEADFAMDEVKISCTDRRGREVPGAATSAGIAESEADRASALRDWGNDDRRVVPVGGPKRGGRSRRSSRRKR